MKVCLDTCAFFSMIKYNEIYNAGGKSALEEALIKDQEAIENYKKHLMDFMYPEFVEKNKDKSPDVLFERYKSWKNQFIKNFDSRIALLEENLNGYFYSNGKRIHIDISEEKRQRILNDIKKLKERHDGISATDELFTKELEDYKLLINHRQMGLVFKDHLEGKYEFYITPNVYAEINNHSAESDSIDGKGDVKFEFRKINSLMENHCTFLAMNDKTIRRKAQEISRKLRTKQYEGVKQMAPDRNSIRRFGDAMIMAEASLAGINLVTLNRKDFIFDKSVDHENENIRKHVALVERDNAPYTTDALAYSAEELLANKVKEPTIQSHYDIEQKHASEITREDYEYTR